MLHKNKSPAPSQSEARQRFIFNQTLVVLMDDGLASVAVAVFLFNDRGTITINRFVLPDHGLFLDPIAVVIVTAFANGHAGAYGANANADLISQGRRGQSTGRHGRQQNLPHCILLLFNGWSTSPGWRRSADTRTNISLMA
jgi:hypothetical protein